MAQFAAPIRFAGDRKLNVAKSELPGRAKAGRVLVEADRNGGYREIHEIIFEADPPVRLMSRIQFNGSPEDDSLDGSAVQYTSRRDG